MSEAIIDKINKVWKDLYGDEAVYKTDDHASVRTDSVISR